MGVSTKMANYSAVALTMSPGHARLNELTSRMQSVHDDFESEKRARSSVMELKCRAIDEKIMRNKRSEDERLKPLYILIERLGLDIGSERDQLQILDSKLNNDVKDLEARMAAEIEEQRKQRKERLRSSSRSIRHVSTFVRTSLARRSVVMSPRSAARRRSLTRFFASPSPSTRSARTVSQVRTASTPR